jgi:uncharacterized protein YuzE
LPAFLDPNTLQSTAAAISEPIDPTTYGSESKDSDPINGCSALSNPMSTEVDPKDEEIVVENKKEDQYLDENGNVVGLEVETNSNTLDGDGKLTEATTLQS